MTMTEWPFDEEPFPALGSRPPPGERWSVAFWWLSTGPGVLELLYAWCVARSGDARPRWSAIDCDPVRSETAERDVARCVVDGPTDLIFPFVAAVSRGETLGAAASTAGLPEPPGRFVDCRLGANSNGSASELVRTPWMLLDTSTDASARAAHDQGPESPSAEVPCLIRSVERHDLSTLFADEDGIDRALLASAAVRVAQETGLPFAGSWFERLGAFDVLAFPAAFPDETARVEARVHGGSAIAVSFKLEGLDRVDELIVRCRQRTKGVTLSDEVRTLAVSQPGVVEVLFEGPAGGPYATRVEAWVREVGTGRFRVLFAHTFYWIRQIHIGMNLLDGGATIQAPWLAAFTRARRTRQRAQAMTTRSRFSSDRKMVVGDPLPTFEEVATGRRDLHRRIFPATSGARFFRVGHGADSARLDIAEWFSDIVTDGDAGILVVDPYFDSWGLELIARAKQTDVEWVVLTCLQHRKDGGQAAEERLRAGWEQLAPLLESRKIQVVELKSSGKEAVFHDRYVLTVGSDGLARRGFHLSNSLQAAAVNHPLLVTPIGEDALVDVRDYVRELLDVPTDAEVGVNAPAGVAKRTIVASPRAAVAEAPDVTPVDDADTLLARVLGAPTDETFAREWAALSTVLAHTGNPPLARIASEGGDALAARLEGFVSASPRYEPPQGTLRAPAQRESIGLLQRAKHPFAEVVRDAEQYLEHWHTLLGRPWSLLFATKVLAQLDPGGLTRAADRVTAEAPSASRTLPEQAPAAQAFGHILSSIVNHVGHATRPVATDDHLIVSLARSTTPLLRAVAGASLFHAVRVDPKMVVAADLLLDRDERLLTMAAWVHRLRIAANRAGGTESDEIARVRSAIFKRMIGEWRDRGPDELRPILQLLSGPLEGAWSRSTVSDLLLPLAEEKKQSREAIERTFATIVNQRITGIASGQYHFFYNVDAELTEVAAALLASTVLADDEALELINPTQRAVGRATRILARPFVRSRDYTGWSGAREAITWAAAYGQLMALYGVSCRALVEASAEWIRVREALEQTARDPLVVRDQSNLGAFARAVEKAWRDRSVT